MPRVQLQYVFLDDGEYLYNAKTKKLYTKCAPHIFVGILDAKTQNCVKDDLK
jgi:hypothetical protein